jgi:hypothetical protein
MVRKCQIRSEKKQIKQKLLQPMRPQQKQSSHAEKTSSEIQTEFLNFRFAPYGCEWIEASPQTTCPILFFAEILRPSELLPYANMRLFHVFSGESEMMNGALSRPVFLNTPIHHQYNRQSPQVTRNEEVCLEVLFPFFYRQRQAHAPGWSCEAAENRSLCSRLLGICVVAVYFICCWKSGP